MKKQGATNLRVKKPDDPQRTRSLKAELPAKRANQHLDNQISSDLFTASPLTLVSATVVMRRKGLNKYLDNQV